jgi:hypothetical protein
MNTELLEELREVEKVLTEFVTSGKQIAAMMDLPLNRCVHTGGLITVTHLITLRDRIRGRINIMVHTREVDYDYHRPAE